jgi:hypothetical protein
MPNLKCDSDIEIKKLIKNLILKDLPKKTLRLLNIEYIIDEIYDTLIIKDMEKHMFLIDAFTESQLKELINGRSLDAFINVNDSPELYNMINGYLYDPHIWFHRTSLEWFHPDNDNGYYEGTKTKELSSRLLYVNLLKHKN